MRKLLFGIFLLTLPLFSQITSIPTASSSGSGSSTGAVNAVQSSDGSGGFLASGCTAVSSVMTCSGGFATGGAYSAVGPTQAKPTAPASGSLLGWYDITALIPLWEDSTGTTIATSVVPKASRTTNQFLINIPATGIQTTAAIAAADLPATLTSGTAITNAALTTPSLGTPASGTLTNTTGLSDGGLSLTDVTTNNVSTSKHGFAPKSDNNAAHYLDGTGAYSTPSGGSANSIIGSFGAAFDGAGSAITVNTIRYTRVPFACTITGWSVIGDTGTFTADVLKIATGTTLPTSSIAGSALPALATGNALKSTTLTGWTTSVAADDIVGIKVTVVSGTTAAQVMVECNKS